jgi:hypothetical protein
MSAAMPPPTPLPSDLLRRLRLAAKRLKTYSLRVQTALAAGDRDGLAQALRLAQKFDVSGAKVVESAYHFDLFSFNQWCDHWPGGL